MKFIIGKNRDQIEIYTQSLNETISPDNEVRLIDLFVNSLNLIDYGFKADFIENGRPAFRLLKKIAYIGFNCLVLNHHFKMIRFLDELTLCATPPYTEALTS